MVDSGLRKIVGLCFLACYVLLGVPLWYKLTTVYRAPLPVEYIRSLHEGKFQDVHMVIPVFIKSEVYRFPDIHDAVQVQVNHLLNSKKQYVPWSLQILPYEEYNATGSKYGHSDEYHVVSLVLDEFVGYSVAYDAKETTVFFDDAAVVSNDIPFFVAQSLVEHTFALEWEQLSSDFSRHDDNMVVTYNPNMHLSISLLSGDGSPVRWEIEKTLQHYFTPFRKFLAPLVNFTVDTSIIYYNDLNVHALKDGDSVTPQELSHTIDLSELSSMNYLSESSALNLAIVFPSNVSSPSGLNFIHGVSNNTGSEADWQSFIVPQWGNLIINKNPLPPNALLKESYLVPIMYQFATDLFQLLGLTKGSQDLSSPYVTIDSFKRLTTLRNIDNAEETLWSLVKLTQSFKQMAVPEDVLNNVNQALKLRLEIIDLLNNPEKGGDVVWNQALVLSNKLVKASETAFFHGEMVQQNFFPQEHKIAVYLPLLGPTSVVIFLGLVKLLKERDAEEGKQDSPEAAEKDEKQGDRD
ncbi:hypothetical protein HG536_0A05630 [Torulaspora globosa]|uniref:GPI transamidase component PIG-S n=1 Tax=Torulaspora globosa TaxID=48254 RepID=A0A7G3ZB62_9SACH|nr:uncharacterized protein HG536_0A05630 [Torulaspora globosa]QLL30748.1 hypothetical protein HG536_0A05630 [Torulaspora globosa]